MKNTRLILRFACLSLVCCEASALADGLNSILPPVDVKEIPEDSVREVKHEGEQYFGRAVVQMVGKGSLRKWKGVFGSDISDVRYTGDAAWRETVIKVDAEKKQTVTRIEFIRLESRLEGAKASMHFLEWDSKESLKWVKDNRPAVVDSVSLGIKGLMLYNGFPPIPGTGFVVDKLLKAGEKKAERAGYTIDKDGNLLVPGQRVQDFLGTGKGGEVGKAVAALAVRVNPYKTSVWDLVWSWETRDYALVSCFNKEAVEAAAKAESAEVYTDQRLADDFDLVQRMIRRSSMLSERMLFPVEEIEKEGSLRVGKEWWVNSNAFGKLISQGVEFDRLDGKVACVFQGWDARADLEDENANTGKDRVAVAKISIAPGYENLIEGKLKRVEADSITTFSMTPTGTFTIVADQAIASRYLREATLSGTMHSVDRRHVDSLLRGVDITGDLKMQAKVTQLRVAPEKGKSAK